MDADAIVLVGDRGTATVAILPLEPFLGDKGPFLEAVVGDNGGTTLDAEPFLGDKDADEFLESDEVVGDNGNGTLEAETFLGETDANVFLEIEVGDEGVTTLGAEEFLGETDTPDEADEFREDVGDATEIGFKTTGLEMLDAPYCGNDPAFKDRVDGILAIVLAVFSYSCTLPVPKLVANEGSLFDDIFSSPLIFYRFFLAKINYIPDI